MTGEEPEAGPLQETRMKIVVDREADRQADREVELKLNRIKHITSTIMVIAVWAGVALCTWALTGIPDGRNMVAYVSVCAFIAGSISTYFVTRRP